jgi:Saxitoxin biosynthesis operon protein SxtJ
MSSSTHENVHREETVTAGSDRSFGWVFTGFCAIVAAVQFWLGHGHAWGWLVASLAFAGTTLVYSRALRPLNVLWFKFGMLLHRVVSPVVLGIMFFAVFTPIGWIMRLTGKRPLNLAFDAEAPSYWVQRKPPAPPPGSFDQQF